MICLLARADQSVVGVALLAGADRSAAGGRVGVLVVVVFAVCQFSGIGVVVVVVLIVVALCSGGVVFSGVL